MGVGLIYGIGRNYASHAKELGNSVPEKEPMVFLKPRGSIVIDGEKVKLPAFSKNVHYEVELAFRFGPSLEVAEICVANDLTARDVQRAAQEAKSPWTLAKGFKQSCGLGNWISAKDIDLSQLELKLLLNDKIVQHGFTEDMIFNVPALVIYLTERFPVAPGDIVLTGTPEGVGPVKAGDQLDAELLNLGKCISKAHWAYE